MAVLVSESAVPQLATVIPRAMTPLEPDSSRKGSITDIKVDVDASATKVKLLETVNQEIEGIKLEDAEVIVTGGGGIGSSEGFDLLRELARVLRGAVGSTRVPCDEEWVSENLEIGQTGKVVSPDLYIAIGVSGAMQHVAGISGSKYIVAINNNPDATIFTVSNLGMVADYREAVPAVTEELRKILAA
jgi:electron transfer flavoprotein alpha subunit